jgi:hypothetical protein
MEVVGGISEETKDLVQEFCRESKEMSHRRTPGYSAASATLDASFETRGGEEVVVVVVVDDRNDEVS